MPRYKVTLTEEEKNELKPWLVEEWCIPEASAEFVAKMEDVLEVYQDGDNGFYSAAPRF